MKTKQLSKKGLIGSYETDSMCDSCQNFRLFTPSGGIYINTSLKDITEFKRIINNIRSFLNEVESTFEIDSHKYIKKMIPSMKKELERFSRIKEKNSYVKNQIKILKRKLKKYEEKT